MIAYNENTDGKQFMRQKVSVLKMPIVIIPSVGVKVNRTNWQTGLPDTSGFLSATQIEYAPLWNTLHDRFEGDGLPGILPEPLPQLGDWYSRNHKACAVLDKERAQITEFFEYMLSLIDGRGSIKHKEANVGFPYFNKTVRASVIELLLNSNDEITSLEAIKNPITVTGWRTQDESAHKKRETTIKGRVVEINKNPKIYEKAYKLFHGACSMKFRTIAIQPALNLYLQVLANLALQPLHDIPIFHFDPDIDVIDEPQKYVSIDFKQFDSHESPVWFEIFYSVIKKKYPVTARIFKNVYNTKIASLEQILDGSYCNYTHNEWCHWGMLSGSAFVSLLNKYVAIYALYVRRIGLSETKKIMYQPNGRKNNGDDNVILRTELSSMLASCTEVGLEAEQESDLVFNGFIVKKRNDKYRWCARAESFWRRSKPEHSAGGPHNPQPWLGFLVGRSFYNLHLSDEDKHIIQDEVDLYKKLYNVDLYMLAKQAYPGADIPIDYFTFLKIAKPDARFWLPALDEGLPGIENLLLYLR